MGRVSEITREIKTYDPCLYAQETKPGRIDLYRKNRSGMEPPHFLFSLTDNWQPHGTPVPWGIEPLLNRIKAMDLWRDDTFIDSWIKSEEKRKLSQDRDRQNSIESFLYDFAKQFQKTTNDINTSGMKEPTRKESYGYC